MVSLMERMKSSGSLPSMTLDESVAFANKDLVMTDIPIINAAFSGKLNGGFSSGLTILAGPSRHFKSNLGLVCLRAYLKKYPDAIGILYDSEFGITPEYIKSNGIDPSRVLHIPLLHVEQLKFDISKKLNDIKLGEKVFILVDSLGNLASKKEVDDAADEKSVADMTRAKAIKSMLRIITPLLTLKDIPCMIINHVYQETGLFAKTIVSGGSGVQLAADHVWIIGRSQDKENDEIIGWDFTINIDKSRFVKEKSKFTFTVNYEKGISRWSGLLDLALEFGAITNTKKGWYQLATDPEKSYREKQLNDKDIWIPILMNEEFRNFVESKFKLSTSKLQSCLDDEADELFN